jgi:predicted dehydrogenase
MLELAVVGAGQMGANHVRVAMGLRDARLAFVVDPDPDRGRPAAEKAGAVHLESVDELNGRADAAIVAVPTSSHLEIGLQLLKSGVHTLMEKPLAPNVDDARQLVKAADDSGALLMVGHIERFNPAVIALPGFVSDPIHIDVSRVSPYTPRIEDGVVMDLMIHDLDILMSLIPSAVSEVWAVNHRVRSTSEDLAVALLGFDNGATATLTASRLGQEKRRFLSITQAAEVIHVDLMRQEITIQSRREVAFAGDGGGIRESGLVETPSIPDRGEPLRLELNHFVESVMTSSKPLVDGWDGVRAIELVDQVLAGSVKVS